MSPTLYAIIVAAIITAVIIALLFVNHRRRMQEMQKEWDDVETSVARYCPVSDQQRLLELKRRRADLESHHESFKRELVSEQQSGKDSPATREALRFQKLELEPLDKTDPNRQVEISLLKPTILQVAERWDAVAR